MRVSPPRIDARAGGAAKPPMGSPGADAFRQTGFVLGAEVETVLRGLELEGAAAEASGGARYRKQPTAAAMLMTSRGWLARTACLQLLQSGNYLAALPLARAATDYIAAGIALLESDAREWQEWLDEGGVGHANDVHGSEYRLHAFRSAETLAAHPDLGRVYRQASDLAMPHFGAALLAAGYESTPERIVATFGDRDFHLGLAELLLGWLLTLGVEQLRAILAHPQHLAAGDDAAVEEWIAAAVRIAARTDRCRMEGIERDGEQRVLVHQWRKRPGDAARRILL